MNMFSLTQMKLDGEKVVELFSQDIGSIRTGRAKPSLVENITVQAYGAVMKVLELASISAPDSTSIVVKPWDTSVLKDIEKAILASDLGIPPVIDGNQIRLSIPALTGERRLELVKLVTQKKNAFLQMLRDVRIKYKKQIEAQKGQAGVSEDAIKVDLENLQKLTEEYSKKLEDVAAQKETELTSL